MKILFNKFCIYLTSKRTEYFTLYKNSFKENSHHLPFVIVNIKYDIVSHRSPTHHSVHFDNRTVNFVVKRQIILVVYFLGRTFVN